MVSETGNDEDVNDYVKVSVENTDLCPRYCARVVIWVVPVPIFTWHTTSLSASGCFSIFSIRPISNGMMCSIEELGSNRDMYPEAPEEGIYIFPEDAQVGESAVKALGLDDVGMFFNFVNLADDNLVKVSV